MRKVSVSKILIFIALIAFWTTILSSCALTKQQRKDNRVAKKIEKIKLKHPESFKRVNTQTVRIDTVIKEVKIEGETKLDTVVINNFLTQYLHDTVERTRFITRFIEVAKDTVDVDSLGISLWIEGVGVIYKLQKDEQHITAKKDVETITIDKTNVVSRIPWWVWAIIISMGVVIVLILLRR